jgi:DUF971 family protein
MALKRTPVPVHVDLDEEGRLLALTWQDGKTSRHRAFDLRAGCPCAGCVDEMTGKRTLRPEDVDPGVAAREVGRVGRYALRIRWSDGHDTGIYSYESLREGLDPSP